MGFDGAVSGGHYLFGESISLIDFIKVHFFPPSSGWQLVTAHHLVPLICLALKWPPASSSSSLIAILYSNCSADRSPNFPSLSWLPTLVPGSCLQGFTQITAQIDRH